MGMIVSSQQFGQGQTPLRAVRPQGLFRFQPHIAAQVV
jgi:hypothetical protein